MDDVERLDAGRAGPTPPQLEGSLHRPTITPHRIRHVGEVRTREDLRRLVGEERCAQGLPPLISDPVALTRMAARLREVSPRMSASRMEEAARKTVTARAIAIGSGHSPRSRSLATAHMSNNPVSLTVDVDGQRPGP
jgi:hypothetical protein